MSEKQPLRDESTPGGKKIWAAVDKAAAKAPVTDPTPKLTEEAPKVRETTVTEWHLTSHMLRQLAEYQRELAAWVVAQTGASAVRSKAFEQAASLLDTEETSWAEEEHLCDNKIDRLSCTAKETECHRLAVLVRALAKEQPSTET